jgi:hypothetical protein
MTLFELGSLSLSVAKPTSRNKPQAKCQKADGVSEVGGISKLTDLLFGAFGPF